MEEIPVIGIFKTGYFDDSIKPRKPSIVRKLYFRLLTRAYRDPTPPIQTKGYLHTRGIRTPWEKSNCSLRLTRIIIPIYVNSFTTSAA